MKTGRFVRVLSGDPVAIASYQKQRIYAQNRETQVRSVAQSYLANGCTDCKVTDQPLEFDHLPGYQKTRIVADYRYWAGRDLSEFLSEIAKTEVVCVACHRRRTNERLVHSTDSRAQAMRDRRYKNKMKEISRILETGCECCGKNATTENIRAFDFDHIDPSQKRYHLSDVRHMPRAHEEELQKCRVLCKRCHMEHTRDALKECIEQASAQIK